jgi:hypothetical protein
MVEEERLVVSLEDRFVNSTYFYSMARVIAMFTERHPRSGAARNGLIQSLNKRLTIQKLYNLADTKKGTGEEKP